MEKVKKLIRLSPEVADQLKEIAGTLNISENEAVSRAITYFYMSLKQEIQQSTAGGIIPLSKYEQVQKQLEQAIYKIGELQGKLEAKEEMIQLLKERIRELEARPSKRWWQFWRRSP